jgi:pyruvate dehydrogenase complex dehydrogenase (E1) component
LASWTIHNANHLRESRDGLKVGGHQASCASMTTLMTALYMKALRPQDRVAVKPHASPVFHAIQHLFGRQSLENLKAFRALGGAQSYPVADQGHGRRRFLDRFGGPGRGHDRVRFAGPGLSGRPRRREA